MYKFVDLFCGLGGFRLALEGQKLECVFSSDIDKAIQKAYARNFGDTPRGDITKISENQIPRHDVLCAGFPCQSFSISGKQLGIGDSNGRLFYEIVRIARHHQPKVILLENVKNILTVNNGNAIKTIEQELDEIGYKVNKYLLNASLFGIPQSRERVYFVCLRKDLVKLKSACPKETYEQIFLEDVLERDVDKRLYLTKEIVGLNLSHHSRQLKPIRIGQVNKGRQGERIYSSFGHAITLSAFGGGVGAKTGLYYDRHNDVIRRLSISECKHLMGFPKNHYVSDGVKGYQQLGNAVIPKMIKAVFGAIIDSYTTQQKG